MAKKTKVVLGILISGHGSNMLALIKHTQNFRHPNISVGCVVSDQANAPGLTKASKLGIPAKYIFPGPFKTKLEGEAEQDYIDHLKKYGINWVCLAGFMRVIKRTFIEAFPNRILNIHPSLLPAYKGLNTHERVIAAKEKYTGCTVHLVDEGIDTGKILGQRQIAISPKDTPVTLAQKVIREEHILYCSVIDRIFSNTLS